MSSALVIREDRGPVSRLSLNRPAQMNALGAELLGELAAYLFQLAFRDDFGDERQHACRVEECVALVDTLPLGDAGDELVEAKALARVGL